MLQVKNAMSNPEYAYHIERHSGVVCSQQDEGVLYPCLYSVRRVGYVQEFGLGFYIIDCQWGFQVFLFEGDCTQHITELRKDEPIVVVRGNELPYAVSFNQDYSLIAFVVASGNSVVFKAEGFNREKVKGLEDLVQLLETEAGKLKF